MSPEPTIDFRKERSFGDILNVTFVFIRQNLAPLVKGLLFFVAPFLVGAMLFNVLAQTNVLSGALLNVDGDAEALEALFSNYLGIFFFSLLGMVMALGVVYGLMERYRENGPERLTVEGLWQEARRRFFRMLGTMLFLLLTLGGLYLVLVTFLGVMAAGLAGNAGMVGGVVFFLLLMGIIGVLFYFGVVLLLLFPMRSVEPVGLLEGMGRCFRLARGHWGATFGVVFVAWLISSVLGGIFSLPAVILMFMQGLHGGGGAPGPVAQVMLVTGGVVSGIAGALLYSIPLVATGLQYYNLVERKERVGLMERIRRMEEAGAEGGDEAVDG